MAERRKTSWVMQHSTKPRRENRRSKEKHRLSRRVRRILLLEGTAARYRARYEAVLSRVATARHTAEQLRQEAFAIKVKLSPHELHDLRRIRSGV